LDVEDLGLPEHQQLDLEQLEVAEAQQRYQLLQEGDQLYLGGQFEAATALYRQAKPDFAQQPETSETESIPAPIVDPAQLPPGGQVYWREYQAGVEKQLKTRIQVPLELLSQRYPQFIPGQIRLAEFLVAEGEVAAAVAGLEAAVGLYPQEAELVQALVAYNGELENWLEASMAARRFALFNPDHPDRDTFQQLADENLDRFQSALRGKLIANTVANVFLGAASYALTGGLYGPISALQSSAMLLQGESGIGNSVTNAIKKQVPLVEDEEVVTYVDELGQRLAQVAGRDEFDYEFYVILEPELNAFALPGGKIFVNAGAIAKTNSEAELAGLLAHEISHAVLSHGFQLASEGTLLSNISQYIPFGGTAANLVVLNYSRRMERQADELGTQILASSGYAADGVRNLMVTLAAETEGEELPPVWLSTHPQSTERIANMERQIITQGLNRYGFEGVIRHQEVQEKVKAMLAEIEEPESIEYDETLLPENAESD
jgi:predicted Zn-dependent protease